MIYAFPFSPCKRAAIATFDLSASNLALLKLGHRLADDENVMQLRLTSAAWEGGCSEVHPEPLGQAGVMQSWTVDALATFLQGEDLCGPAEALRSAGVNGSDFLAWKTEGELAADLRLPPFVASKLLACRTKLMGAA